MGKVKRRNQGAITMRITQGAFSFLPDLTDQQIASQVQYCINNGWAVSLEFTDDPHPRNTYWDMWGHPMFDNPDAGGAAGWSIARMPQGVYRDRYIRVIAFDATPAAGSRSAHVLSSSTGPPKEPGFQRRARQEVDVPARPLHDDAYATNKPAGESYAR
jgi:ribulose-bisphosphate carboxylase small chain